VRTNLAVSTPRSIKLDKPNAIRVDDLGVKVSVGERDDVGGGRVHCPSIPGTKEQEYSNKNRGEVHANEENTVHNNLCIHFSKSNNP
jgi:hypothetical protein